MSVFKRYWKWPLSLDVIWLLVPLLGIIARLSVEPIAPYDYWWSLAMGRIIALGGQIPDSNLFLYTLDVTTPFFNQPWLAQWLMYVLYEWVGHTGLVLVRNGIVALTWFGVLWLALRRCADARLVGGLSLAIVVVGGVVFGVRTQMFAFLPFVATLIVLVQVVEKQISQRFLWVLVPLVAVWANLHGTFVLAPVMAGCVGGGFLAERLLRDRRVDFGEVVVWGGLPVMLGLGALLNPYGPGLYGYVIELFTNSSVSSGVTEWQPVDPTTGIGALVLGLMIVSLVILFLRRKSVRLWEALLFVAMAYLGMSSIRSIFWWAAVWLIVIPPHLQALVAARTLQGEQEDVRVSQGEGVMHAVMVVMMVVIGVCIQPGMPLHRLLRTGPMVEQFRHEKGQQVLDRMNAVDLVGLLKERGYPGRIFHEQALGGLLEFGLTEGDLPQAVSFVDQRIELIPERVWDEYFLVSQGRAGWQEIVARYGIETLVLGEEEQAGLIQVLEEDSDWIEVWQDAPYRVFFSKAGAARFTQWRSEPTEINTDR